MGLDDLFKHRKGHGDHGHRGYDGHGRGHDDHGRGHDDHGHGNDGHGRGYGYGGGDHHAMKRELLGKLLANKPLLVGLAVVALLLLAVAAWIAIGLLSYLSQYGVKGLVEKFDVAGLLKKLWEGVGK